VGVPAQIEAAPSGFALQSFARGRQKDFHCNPSRKQIVNTSFKLKELKKPSTK
jgi:hypothetical protein